MSIMQQRQYLCIASAERTVKVNFINREKVIKAKDNKSIVTWMRKHDSQKLETNEEFMLAYSRRKDLYDNKQLRPDNENVFVEDLLKQGYIEILD